MASVDSGRVQKRFALVALENGSLLGGEVYDTLAEALSRADFLNDPAHGDWAPVGVIEVFDIAPTE
jgi:hypothetical protein